jgi:Mlc titration factor MtfA (ptsG expression regulator)
MLSPSAPTDPVAFSRVQWAVAHELGHALDFNDRMPTGVGAEFDKVTSQKSPDRTPITAYAATNRGEYFAEAFALWALDPAELGALRPDVFALFQRRYRP